MREEGVRHGTDMGDYFVAKDLPTTVPHEPRKRRVALSHLVRGSRLCPAKRPSSNLSFGVLESLG